MERVFQKLPKNNSPYRGAGSAGMIFEDKRSVVQRLKGASGTKEEGKDVPFTLNQKFVDKHVADSEQGAIDVTEARIDSGGPPGIVNGTAPNNVAKQADWEKALTDSEAEVPPDGEWEGIHGDSKDNWVDKLTRVEVPGWEAQGTKGKVAAKSTVNKKYLGGEWSVNGCQFDEEEDYVNKSGQVTMDISHLTS